MVGIVGYGSYLPRYRIKVESIAKEWGSDPEVIKRGLQLYEKTVPGLDEDTITISVEAARNALKRAGIDPKEIGAVYVGSESHPYAVKPTSTIIAEAIGAAPHVQAADMEFACKAGTEAMVMAMGLVGSGMARYAVAGGLDTAQGKPGDALEYTAAAGGAAFIIGPAQESLAVINATYSFVTDTPDFWRREYQHYPEHGNRFTGEPAYFKHILTAGRTMLESLGTTAKDYQWAVFHQPNTKFPQKIAKDLGFTPDQIKTGLLTPVIGNTYAGSSLVGLTAVLDVADPGDLIFVTSYGSGAGSDSFIIQALEPLQHRRVNAPSTQDYIARRTEIDYATYVRYRGEIRMR